MPYFRVITFGCKVNQVDTAGLAQTLEVRGWQAAPPGVAPELLVVNTCTVTNRADQQARQAIRRLAREYPGAAIWVTGCYAQRAPEEVAALPGVQAVVGNREKAQLAELGGQLLWPSGNGMAHSPSLLRGEGRGGGEILLPPPPFPLPPGEGEITYLVGERQTPCHSPEKTRPHLYVGTYSLGEEFHSWPGAPLPGHTRAWLKIQDGCSHRCSYCIVPEVRGPGRSMAPGAVRAALEELARRDHGEVVLTGVNLGQYGRDFQPVGSLAGLLHLLKTRTWPFRVRLSSLEPQEVTAALLRELAGWEGFCPHFHLPLQSGASGVLAAMGRPYGPQDFLELVDQIRRLFPDAALGLDILVGFPGETAADFEATRSLVASLPVTYLHVFPFSPRPRTPAAQLPRLAAGEVRERAKIMRALGAAQKRQFLQSQVGQTREVLVEGPAPQAGWLTALSDNYLRVLLPGPGTWRNRRLKARFLQLEGEVLRAEVVGGGGQGPFL